MSAPTNKTDLWGGEWPPEALADPPKYPFKMDRHAYDSPEMAAWRIRNGIGPSASAVKTGRCAVCQRELPLADLARQYVHDEYFLLCAVGDSPTCYESYQAGVERFPRPGCNGTGSF